MSYSAPELLRAAGLFVAEAPAGAGIVVLDGVAYVAPDAAPIHAGELAVMAANPGIPQPEAQARAARLMAG